MATERLVLPGIVKNGLVVPQRDTPLPDGARVDILLGPAAMPPELQAELAQWETVRDEAWAILPFEDVPLDEARLMSRRLRMDPERYQELRTRMQALSDRAVRMTIPDGSTIATMKQRIRSVAAELGIPVTIRRVRGGLLFWRSTDEDIQVAKEVGARFLKRLPGDKVF
jgi:hypothetical protein